MFKIGEKIDVCIQSVESYSGSLLLKQEKLVSSNLKKNDEFLDYIIIVEGSVLLFYPSYIYSTQCSSTIAFYKTRTSIKSQFHGSPTRYNI